MEKLKPMPRRKCPKCGRKTGYGMEFCGKFVACQMCLMKHIAKGGTLADIVKVKK